MGKRHTARRLVMQALYEHENSKAPCVDIVARSVRENETNPEGGRFAEELAHQIDNHRSEIESEIRKHLKSWNYERLSLVDRSILSLAIGEMMYTNEPPAVVLDEAVLLSEEYGGEDSPHFVNGVLGAVYRDRYNPASVHSCLPESFKKKGRSRK